MYSAAVIGLGKIGLLFDLDGKRKQPLSHTVAYLRDPHVELTAAVGVRTEQRDNLHKVAPDVAFYLDPGEMMSRHKLDIVSICTPAHVRYDLIEQVLEQAKPRVIFCEKPVATSIGEAEHIVSLLQRHNTLLLPNLSRRYNKMLARLRAAVREELYGRLLTIHLRYTRGIYNSGSHLFDLVRYFTGGITSVQVLREQATALNAEVDPTYAFLFAAGVDGNVSGYAEAFDDRNYSIFEIDLYMERGKIEMANAGNEVRYYRAGDVPNMPQFYNLIHERTETGVDGEPSNIQNAVAHIVDILDRGTEPVCTVEDGNFPTYVADALLRSRRNGGTREEV
ncbi:Gfo/Idh/MocA family protein [Paenibacillus cymbidii]|uniref:Gfo/Idh/MocA family protein n=1 Tax=Paenibacillus cymbidii TaxID=1639034 RepID=UPI001436954B|nr:Gfo/Idh/MocA family oxidoreductase [Paenibacillus cymbidii]